MTDIHDLKAVGVNLSSFLYHVAVENAKVVTDDPSTALSIVFNALIAASSRAIAVAATSGRTEETINLLPKVYRELSQAANDILTRNAGDGFKMIVIDR